MYGRKEMSAQILEVGHVYIGSRNGAPSSKGCLVHGQTTKASNKNVPPLPPPPLTVGVHQKSPQELGKLYAPTDGGVEPGREVHPVTVAAVVNTPRARESQILHYKNVPHYVKPKYCPPPRKKPLIKI